MAKKFSGRAGNGWVMAGLVRVLATLPSDDPLRPHYIALLREMAAEVASVQGSDGLWRPGLLDAASYPLPEVSGSAFFTYAIAWGIDHHMLDADIYLPVVEKAWAGHAGARVSRWKAWGDSADWRSAGGVQAELKL